MLLEEIFCHGYRTFFTHRAHQTKIGSVQSILSGVVQGSGSGPIVFLSVHQCFNELMICAT